MTKFKAALLPVCDWFPRRVFSRTQSYVSTTKAVTAATMLRISSGNVCKINSHERSQKRESFRSRSIDDLSSHLTPSSLPSAVCRSSELGHPPVSFLGSISVNFSARSTSIRLRSPAYGFRFQSAHCVLIFLTWLWRRRRRRSASATFDFDRSFRSLHCLFGVLGSLSMIYDHQQ